MGVKQALAFRTTILCQDHANNIRTWLVVNIDANPPTSICVRKRGQWINCAVSSIKFNNDT